MADNGIMQMAFDAPTEQLQANCVNAVNTGVASCAVVVNTCQNVLTGLENLQTWANNFYHGELSYDQSQISKYSGMKQTGNVQARLNYWQTAYSTDSSDQQSLLGQISAVTTPQTTLASSIQSTFAKNEETMVQPVTQENNQLIQLIGVIG